MDRVVLPSQEAVEKFWDPDDSVEAYSGPARTAATNANATPASSAVKEPQAS